MLYGLLKLIKWSEIFNYMAIISGKQQMRIFSQSVLDPVPVNRCRLEILEIGVTTARSTLDRQRSNIFLAIKFQIFFEIQ